MIKFINILNFKIERRLNLLHSFIMLSPAIGVSEFQTPLYLDIELCNRL